mmetsp:Transcript_24360/g.32338  ORF Transcript_24360/g.32338 Transcript_24360/m.32338 type:complete len:107 (-) Transcript_24360:116-436(-)
MRNKQRRKKIRDRKKNKKTRKRVRQKRNNCVHIQRWGRNSNRNRSSFSSFVNVSCYNSVLSDSFSWENHRLRIERACYFVWAVLWEKVDPDTVVIKKGDGLVCKTI